MLLKTGKRAFFVSIHVSIALVWHGTFAVLLLLFVVGNTLRLSCCAVSFFTSKYDVGCTNIDTIRPIVVVSLLLNEP